MASHDSNSDQAMSSSGISLDSSTASEDAPVPELPGHSSLVTGCESPALRNLVISSLVREQQAHSEVQRLTRYLQGLEQDVSELEQDLRDCRQALEQHNEAVQVPPPEPQSVNSEQTGTTHTSSMQLSTSTDT